jgi:excisionase family DNA binding protein
MQRSTLTVVEAAYYIGVSEDTIYNAVRENKIPHARARHRIIFHKSTLNVWLAKQEGYNTSLADGNFIKSEVRGEWKEKLKS